MTEVILDKDTPDEVLSSLAGKWIQKNPVEGFVDYPKPFEIQRAWRLANGWIRIDFIKDMHVVFNEGKVVVWNA